MERPFACFLAPLFVAVTACGSSPDEHGDPDGRFTLSARLGEDSEGLVLGTGAIVPVHVPEIGTSDIYLFIRLFLELRGAHQDGSFCAKGTGYPEVAEIPTGVDDCAWTGVVLSEGAPDAVRGVARDGYLVRSRDGEQLYRLLILDHAVGREDEINVGTATFDLLPID
jgi:hypothetical protein